MRFADGSAFYVQPGILAAAGEDVLVAGRIAYLHTRDSSGRIRSQVADSILGAVVSGTGAAAPVPSPIPTGRIAVIRAAGRSDEGWDVVIGEQRHAAAGAPLPSDTLTRLWHAVYGRTGWGPLTELPIPAGTVLGSDGVSALVRHDDSLSFAAMTVFGTGRDVVVFQRGSTWEAVRVPVGTASYVALGSSPKTGVVLAVTQRAMGGERESMALYTYHARRGWAPRRVDGGNLPAHQPVIASTESGVTLGWTVPRPTGDASLVFGADDDGEREVTAVLVDSLYASPRPIPLLGSAGEITWIVDRAGGPGTTPQFQVLRGESRVVHPAGQVMNPFYGGLFRATPAGRHDLVLSGPVIRDSVPVSYTIRTRITCD